MAGLYIHIPFCKSRCVYCDFASSTLGEAWMERYLEALEAPLRLPPKGGSDSDTACLSTARHSNPPPPLGGGQRGAFTTIYIGGGTPSLLPPRLLLRLFEIVRQHFTWDEDAEITIEANPDDVTDEWVSALQKTPVNRISMGLQSTDDGVLKFLRRRHTAQQAEEAVRRLQQVGYRNLSLDLIYGLPGQTLAMFEQDVRRVLSLGVTHLSAYALQFEPGTALWQMRERGEVQEADEELSRACYYRLIDLTEAAGFEHYEISNFALPGYRSRHNSSYWQGLPYLGLGAGAHSYDGKRTRWSNTADVREFVEAFAPRKGSLESKTFENFRKLSKTFDAQAPESKAFEAQAPESETFDAKAPASQEPALTTVEHLSPAELYDERIMLSLRTCEGLSLTALERDLGTARLRHCLRQAQPHLAAGLLTHQADRLRLTRQGLFVSDSIIVDLLA